MEIEQQAARYTKSNGFMVENPRPTRINLGSGIKLFEGKALADISEFDKSNITADELRESFRVWRPEDTVEAIKTLKQSGRLLIVGEPQSGKGTLLFGISDVCDKQGLGYLMIDGHWLEAPASKIISAIKKADEKGEMIFYDSFDYLFASSNKIRKQNKEMHAQRTREIIGTLKSTQVPLVMTFHDENWSRIFLDKNLLEENQDFLKSFSMYELSRYIGSKESRLAFLVDHEYSFEDACQLLNLPDNPRVLDVIASRVGKKKYKDQLELALKDYGVLKKLARNYQDDTKGLMSEVEGGDEEATIGLVYLILSTQFESDFSPILRWQK